MKMLDEKAICEEIGADLYNFKSVMESALDLISKTVTKDQRGDFIMPTLEGNRRSSESAKLIPDP